MLESSPLDYLNGGGTASHRRFMLSLARFGGKAEKWKVLDVRKGKLTRAIRNYQTALHCEGVRVRMEGSCGPTPESASQ